MPTKLREIVAVLSGAWRGENLTQSGVESIPPAGEDKSEKVCFLALYGTVLHVGL